MEHAQPFYQIAIRASGAPDGGGGHGEGPGEKTQKVLGQLRRHESKKIQGQAYTTAIDNLPAGVKRSGRGAKANFSGLQVLVSIWSSFFPQCQAARCGVGLVGWWVGGLG